MPACNRFSPALLAIAVALLTLARGRAEPIPVAEIQRETPVDFEREIAPLLARSCLACHNRTKAESELVLETPESIAKGGALGAAVEPGKPDESLLLNLAAHREEPPMPPLENKVGAPPLSSEELGLLRLWIAQGARGSTAEAATAMAWQPLPESINPIYTIAVSSDGRFAFCNRGSRLHAYDLSARRWLGALVDSLPELAATGAAHHDLCQSLALSPDGHTLASGAYREIKLWRPATTDPAALLELGAEPLCAALTDDGQRWAVGTAKELLVLDLAQRSIAARVPLPAAPRAIAWSADGANLAVLSGESGIELRQATDLAPRGRFTAPRAVGAIAFALDGATLVTGDAQGRIDHWEATAAHSEVARDAEPFTRLGFSRDGSRLVLASRNGALYLLDRTTRRPVRRWLGHASAATAVAWLDEGRTLASISDDRTLRIWNDEQHAPRVSISLGDDTPRGLAVGGGKLWIALESGKLRAYPIEGLAEATPPALEAQLVDAERQPLSKPQLAGFAASPDGATLYAATRDGLLSAYDTANGQAKYVASLAAPVTSLAISHDGGRLAVCLATTEGLPVLRWLNAKDGTPVEAPPADAAPAERIALADEQLAIVAPPGGGLSWVDLTSGRVLETVLPAGVAVDDFAAQGDQMLVSHGNFVEQHARHWRRGAAGHGAAVTSLARVGGERIVSGAADGSLLAWDAAGAPTPLPSVGGPVRLVQPAPGGASALILTDREAVAWTAGKPELTPWSGDVDARLRLAREAALVQGAERRTTVVDEARKVADADTTAARKAETTATQALAKAEEQVTQTNAPLAGLVQAREAAVAAASTASAAATRAAELQQQATARAASAAEAAKPAEAQLAAAQGAADDVTTLVARLSASRELTQRPTVKEVPLVAELAAQLEQSIAAARQAEEAAKVALAAVRAASAPSLEALRLAGEAQAAADAESASAATATKAAEEAQAAAEKAAAEAQKAHDQAVAARTTAQETLTRSQRDREVAERQLADYSRETDALRQRATEAAAALKDLQTTLSTQGSPLTKAAFAAGNPRAIVVTADGSLRLHDTATGAAYRGPRCAEAPRFVTLSGDDQLLYLTATGQLREMPLAPRWERVGRLGPPTDDGGIERSTLADRVTALAFSPDGARLASGGGEPSRSGELALWDAGTGELIWRLPEAHSDTVLSLEFSPDGRYLAAGSADKFLKVFDVTNGQLVRTFEGHTQHVLGVAWRADGLMLASAGGDQAVKLWNYDSGEQLRTVGGFGKAVAGIRFVGDQSQTVSGSGDGVLRMHNADDGQAIRNFAGAKTYLSALALTPDGRRLLAGGADSVLRVWSTGESAVEAEFAPPTKE